MQNVQRFFSYRQLLVSPNGKIATAHIRFFRTKLELFLVYEDLYFKILNYNKNYLTVNPRIKTHGKTKISVHF